MIENYYTVKEAAEKIGCTEGYIRTLISQGKISCQKMGARLNIIHSAEVERIRSMPYRTGRPRKYSKIYS